LLKTISTLIHDIRQLLISEKEAVDTVVHTFAGQLAQTIGSRTSRASDTPTLRLSNLGTPPRKLWYSIRRPELAESLPPNAKLKFLYGDILEETLLYLAEQSGHTVSDRQAEVDLHGVRGRIDAVIDGELVDVKSASTFSFKKFQSGITLDNDPFGYIVQLGGYAAAMGRSRAYWLPVDKTLGHIDLVSLPPVPVDYEALVRDRRYDLEQPLPPQKCYPDETETYYRKPTGNRVLSIGCSYCPFKSSCWSNVRAFLNGGKPKFYTKIVAQPKGEEIPMSEVLE
jgi:hypothetical protein